MAKGGILTLAHQVLLVRPFPAFPWTSPTILSLTLHRRGALSWLVRSTLLLPIMGFAPAASSAFNMLSFLTFTIFNSYPPSQFSSPFPGEAFTASLMRSKALWHTSIAPGAFPSWKHLPYLSVAFCLAG